MTNRFMMSVAAVALIAGTGFASAQGTGMSREAPSAAAPAQQSAPSSAEHGASDRGAAGGQMDRDAAQPETKSTQSEDRSPAAGKSQRADDKMQGSKSKSMSSENADKASDKAGGNKDMKAEGRQDRNGNMNADSKGRTDDKTVGQAGAGPRLSGEQRTRITTVIRDQHIQPVTNVNFAVSVGTRIPRDVSFHPLPAEIVTVYPDWRGYQFILVRDQIVVVNPDTLEIVAVLDA